jgi:hypothetical protein
VNELVRPSLAALKEALDLSHDILKNLELSELSLEALCLKASRLARLLNDESMQKVFAYEASGYPNSPEGVPFDVYKLAQLAGREYKQKDEKTGVENSYAYIQSVGELEASLAAYQAALNAAQDPAVSISSSNPHQYVYAPSGNAQQRISLLKEITANAGKLSSRRALIYNYVTEKYYELKFSQISSDIFSRIRERVDSTIGKQVPSAVNKLTAVYENLVSENPEDWSNAVHSCRRVLQDLADALFPPAADRETEKNNKTMKIKLGRDNYINRLITYATDNSSSGRFIEIVGSQLNFLSDRLEAFFRAAQKGSHDVIATREEADRYVIYTYLIVGDILSLRTSDGTSTSDPTQVDAQEQHLADFKEEAS